MPDSFTHLHVHTEYSMLDGAARVGDVVAAAAADGQPAIGITDHGNMYGVLDFYKACQGPGRQAHHRHRALHGPRAPHRAAGPSGPHRRLRRRRRGRAQGLLPPDRAGREQRRLQEPHPALQPGLPRGLLHASPRSTGSCSRHHHEGIIATTGCLGGHVLQALMQGDERGRPGEGGPPPGHLRHATTSSSRSRTTASPSSTAPTPSCSRSPARSARRCSPPTTATTPTSTTPSPTTPCCACRPGR